MALFEEEPVETAELNGTLVLDADTVAYAVCSAVETEQELLPESFYAPEEWEEIVTDPRYVAAKHCIYEIDIDEAIEAAIEYIKAIQQATLTKEVEVYCSSGRNLRYMLDSEYKLNRSDIRYPNGLKEVKAAIVKHFGGELCTDYEADDIVVYRKRTDPDVILSSVDKDVLKSVPGRHYNYYNSERYGIRPKWVETSQDEADKFPYMQCLMGDQADGIRGVHGIGPKKAEKLLAEATTPAEMWEIVVAQYIAYGMTGRDALRTMRLVNMHQLAEDSNGNLVWEPWCPHLV